ncbi:MAG: acyloxyacyl hydrolase [Gammaproteobacteria bacterium]|nr:MAG: acyloxyacyl hydrolase [Gammaproteobacteria bacterium]
MEKFLKKIKDDITPMTAYLKFIFITALSLFFSSFSYATPHYGANFSYTLLTNEPNSLRGYQLMLNYDPDCFHWREFNVYFDGGFSHFWVTDTPYYTTLNIFSVAPVIRNTFRRRGPIHPYIEISIGLAYLNHTHLDDRNLGIHFAFQDRLGIGMLVGEKEQFSIGLHALHYSNAHLSSNNSGITAPVVLDVGYRFQ